MVGLEDVSGGSKGDSGGSLEPPHPVFKYPMEYGIFKEKLYKISKATP